MNTLRLLIFIAALFGPVLWLQADEIAPGILRTPDARFHAITDFPYQPNYVQIGELRVHYVDEGPRDAAPILLIHGEPTWSYLFRKMIPVLTAAGHRVVVPDMIGFGRSDKFSDSADYTYQMQVDTMLALARKLDLKQATFFGQDWGGLVGLRVVAADPDRFDRVAVSNTGLPAAQGALQGVFGYALFKFMVWWEGPMTLDDLRADLSFPRWVAFSYHMDALPIGDLMGFMGSDSRTRAAYEAPFPDARYQAGARIMPYLVPSQLRENALAWNVFQAWKKPFLVAFTDSDPITRGGEQPFLEQVPTARNIPIKGAGHFVQEDAGPELANLLNDFIANKPLPAEIVISERPEPSP